jgi:hypothetical protein
VTMEPEIKIGRLSPDWAVIVIGSVYYLVRIRDDDTEAEDDEGAKHD